MSRIKSIKAREIFNSNSDRAVEVELCTDLGVFNASVPSGVSKGKYEAVERKDAVQNIENVIAPGLEGKDTQNQEELDKLMIELDGTENKSKLGVNAILPVSVAICRASARANNLFLWEYISGLMEQGDRVKKGLRLEQKATSAAGQGDKGAALRAGLRVRGAKVPCIKIKDNYGSGTPKPCILLIEGGLHAGNKLNVQEFMICPSGNSFKEQLERGDKIYDSLGALLKESFGRQALNTGLEGGMTPSLKYSEQAIALISEVTQRYDPEAQIVLDIAASHFYDETNRLYKFEGSLLSGAELFEFYKSAMQGHNILGFEDPFSEDDLNSWEIFSKESFFIGDDLTVTNAKKIKVAAEQGLISGVVIKPNQVGTVTETLGAVYAAQKNGLKVFVKHRSGETNDTFISDFAVGVGADYIMAGAPCHGERVAKYNRLLKIESEM